MNSNFIVFLRKRTSDREPITEADISQLQTYLFELTQDIEKTIKAELTQDIGNVIKINPETGKRLIMANFREIDIEYQLIQVKLKDELKSMVKAGFKEDSEDYILIKEYLSCIEDAFGYLLQLLYDYYPEVAKNNIQLYEKFKPDLLKYLPTKNKHTKTPGLTLNQIALKAVYEHKRIMSDNPSRKLYQLYSYYKDETNRKGVPEGSKRKCENKIKLFKSVIELLQNPYKNRAIDELNILIKAYETEYL